MKAIKDCEWEVNIYWTGLSSEVKWYKWKASTMSDCGTRLLKSSDAFTDEDWASDNWEEFARINNITNYKFVD